LKSAFRKISRVGSLTGATKWYLSDDCLLAAKRVMYTVEYRRFYLRDLESIVIWPNRAWIVRPIIFGGLLGLIGILLWNTVNFTTGAITWGIAALWLLLEVGLGPTAHSRIRTTGATVDLPLVKRARRARHVLEKVEAAVRASRGGVIEQPVARTEGPAQTSVQTGSETPPAAAPIGDLT
jgi:hypothetical protein